MQVDAFLLVLRQRGEIAGALTGVVRVARSRLGPPGQPAVDFDWPFYADAPGSCPTSYSRPGWAPMWGFAC